MVGTNYQQSPGYQFQLGQGINAVQNAASATGGINGGNAQKAISQYATGLAGQDYYNWLGQAGQDYFNFVGSQQNQQSLYQNNQNNLFNMLNTITGSGQNAGAQLGALGSTAATNQGNFITQGANATAAGTIGSANALGGALTGVGNAANSYGQNQLLAALISNGGVGNGGGSSASGFDAQNSII
jgi:hypothetical protein